MIIQIVYLNKYDWILKIYYDVEYRYSNLILRELNNINCESRPFYQLKFLLNFNKNFGFTYTDGNQHVSFIIIGKTDAVEEFQSTLDHEKGHAAMHIAQYYDLNIYGENFQYLQGELSKQMFPIAKRFLCDNC